MFCAVVGFSFFLGGLGPHLDPPATPQSLIFTRCWADPASNNYTQHTSQHADFRVRGVCRGGTFACVALYGLPPSSLPVEVKLKLPVLLTVFGPVSGALCVGGGGDDDDNDDDDTDADEDDDDADAAAAAAADALCLL